MPLAGFEARGLIFGAPLALALGTAFVPLRKPGKLPGACSCGMALGAPAAPTCSPRARKAVAASAAQVPQGEGGQQVVRTLTPPPSLPQPACDRAGGAKAGLAWSYRPGGEVGGWQRTHRALAPPLPLPPKPAHTAAAAAPAGATVSEEYKTEYSTDKIEMHEGAVQPGQRVLLVDDLIATGGTLNAGINLIRECGHQPHQSTSSIILINLIRECGQRGARALLRGSGCEGATTTP